MDDQGKLEQLGFDPFEEAERITRYQLHVHYCENQSDAIIDTFDDQISWFGASEGEYAVGREVVDEIIRSITGYVVKCSISDEQFDVISPVPNIYICSGTYWISTDPSTGVYVRFHQRIAMIIRAQCEHRFHSSDRPFAAMCAQRPYSR